MWNRIKKAFKFWSVVYGSTLADAETPYLLRIMLTPKTRWGQLRMNVFFRGDKDPDPHDHPWPFWTFPLRSYREWYVDGTGGHMRQRVVKAFRLHHRPAGFKHIVQGPADLNQLLGGRAFATFMWTGPWEQDWGFYVNADHDVGRPDPWFSNGVKVTVLQAGQYSPNGEVYYPKAHQPGVARRRFVDFDEPKTEWMYWRYYVDGLNLAQARQQQLMDYHAGLLMRLR